MTGDKCMFLLDSSFVAQLMDEPAAFLRPLSLYACTQCPIGLGVVVGVGLGIALILILVRENPNAVFLVLNAEALEPLVERNSRQAYFLGDNVRVP